MDSLHQRLLNTYDFLLDRGEVHTKAQFAAKIGKTPSQVADAFRNRPKYCTPGLMNAIAKAYPELLNEDYLLNGEGEVGKTVMFEIDTKMADGYAKLLERNYNGKLPLRPHIQAKAAAGFMDGISQGEYGDDLRPMIPFMRDYDFTIEVKGKSMLPDYREGDILACKISRDRLNPPVGEICVLDTKDGAVLKEIMDVEESSIVLHSLNPRYKNYPVDFEDINRIAVVVGMVRNF